MNGFIVAAWLAVQPGGVDLPRARTANVAAIEAFGKQVFHRQGHVCTLLGESKPRYRNGTHWIYVTSHARGLALADIFPLQDFTPNGAQVSREAPEAGVVRRQALLFFWLEGYLPGDQTAGSGLRPRDPLAEALPRMRDVTLLGTLLLGRKVQAFAPFGVWAYTLGSCNFDSVDNAKLIAFLEHEYQESRLAHIGLLQEWFGLNQVSRDLSMYAENGDVRRHITRAAEACWRRRRPDCEEFVGVLLAVRPEAVEGNEP